MVENRGGIYYESHSHFPSFQQAFPAFQTPTIDYFFPHLHALVVVVVVVVFVVVVVVVVVFSFFLSLFPFQVFPSPLFVSRQVLSHLSY